MRHITCTLLVSTSLFVVPQIGLSALVVDWGGDYVSANRAFQNGSIAERNYGGFIDGDPQVISPATENYAGTNARFYGHMTWSPEEGSATGAGGQVVHNGGSDRIELKRGYTDLSAVILWKQADFLNDLDAGNVSFDADSTVQMNINTYAAFDPGRVVIRLSGGSQDGYYISSETPFNGTGTKSANLTSLTWLAYDPASSLDTFGDATSLVSGGLISNVSEVGFYFNESTGALTTDATALRLDSFEVTAIPEPTVLPSALVGAGLVAVRRRRTACTRS